MGLPSCAVAVLAGTLALLALPSVPPLPLVVTTSLAASLVCARFIPWAAVPVTSACLAFLWAALHADHELARRWPVQASHERVVVVATIDSIPVADELGWRFDATARADGEAAGWSRRMRITWPFGVQRPHAGERWRLLVAAATPQSRSNPYGPDGERQLFRERVHAFGRVIDSRLNRRLATGARPLAALRERIAERIAARVADRDAAALIAALAVGHTGDMSREQWRVFNATGTTHLVAISGLHVTLFAVLAIAAARRAWRALPFAVSVPRETFAAALGLSAATAYALLAGFSVPTQRTLVMLGAWFAARAVLRHATAAYPLAAALLVVLALDPFAVLAAGFWLSFTAMAAIVLVTADRVAAGGKTGEAVRVQAAVALVLAPATLAWFGSVSLVGIGVNALAIPLVSFAFVPLVLLAVASMAWAPLSDALLDLAAALHAALWPGLSAAADVAHAVVFAAPPAWWLTAAAIAALLATLPLPAALRVACVAWLIPLAGTGQAPREGELELTLFDTGENMAAIARSERDVLVYGIGEGFGTRGRSVENGLLPFLRATGTQRVSVLVLDRTDRNIERGLNALLANVAVERTFAWPSPCSEQRFRWGSTSVRVAPEGGCAVLLAVGATRVRLAPHAVTISCAGSGCAEYVFEAGRPRPARGQPHAARTLTTAVSGAISVRITATGVERLEERRRTHRRLWSVG